MFVRENWTVRTCKLGEGTGQSGVIHGMKAIQVGTSGGVPSGQYWGTQSGQSAPLASFLMTYNWEEWLTDPMAPIHGDLGTVEEK